VSALGLEIRKCIVKASMAPALNKTRPAKVAMMVNGMMILFWREMILL